jgi:hypothetical protein
MTDEAPRTCNAGGPGLAPDPRIGCQLPEGHDGRHQYEGPNDRGMTVAFAWGSAGPSPTACNDPAPIPLGPPWPAFACTRTPGHDGAHGWGGELAGGAPASVDWAPGQVVILTGGAVAAAAPAEVAAAHANKAAPKRAPAKAAAPKRAPAKAAAPKRARAKG